MTKKKIIKMLSQLLSENYYFDSSKGDANKYEIDSDGEGMTIFNESGGTIYGVCSICEILNGLGLSCFANYSSFRNRLELVVH